jgi:saccharopine dehydrogenase (NAD+, L-lysine-forming)
MSTILVLGGAGGIGQVATQALATSDNFERIRVADLRRDAAQAVVDAVADAAADTAADAAADTAADTMTAGPKDPAARARLEAVAVDASDPASLAACLPGADVVLNCVGPFYRFGPPILEAAIEAGVDYVDVCDDLAPTRQMLTLDERARGRGVRALIGMGNSPGLANLFVKLCAEGLLEQVESADIMHIHGGEPAEGPAVIKHRIHAMLNDIPLYLDGELVTVRQLEPSGQAHVVETEFHHVGRYPVYPYPHPETITLPQHIPGLRRATNLGVIFPLSYFELTQQMVRVGACTTAPIEVEGRPVVPIEFSVAHILSQRARLLAEAGIEGPAGCLKVVVGGRQGGAAKTIVFQLSSERAGAGEGTGIPAAAGALLMGRGEIDRQGVFPPEAGVPPLPLLMEAFKAVQALGKGGRDSIRIEMIDADGKVTEMPLPF